MVDPSVGRCGQTVTLWGGTQRAVGALPAGHDGWHRSDQGTEWGIPHPAPVPPTCWCGSYERGVAAGRRQAADALQRAAGSTRETYLRDAFKVAARIAEAAPAEPVEEDTVRGR